MGRTKKHIDIRIGNTDIDVQVWNIVHQHKGFTTSSAYVKQAILEYDRQQTEEDLDAILDIIMK